MNDRRRNLIHFATVDTARLPLGLLDEAAEQGEAWGKRPASFPGT